MQALEEDQPGEKVEHRKVFEEDRDFNQGACPSLACELDMKVTTQASAPPSATILKSPTPTGTASAPQRADVRRGRATSRAWRNACMVHTRLQHVCLPLFYAFCFETSRSSLRMQCTTSSWRSARTSCRVCNGGQPSRPVLCHPPGEFAEAVRNQFMEERMDYFKAVEAALYEEAGFQVF